MQNLGKGLIYLISYGVSYILQYILCLGNSNVCTSLNGIVGK